MVQTRADQDPTPGSGQQTYEEALQRNFFMTKLEDMVAWGRQHSVWPFNFGLSCCYVEMATAFTSRHDIARFGSEAPEEVTANRALDRATDILRQHQTVERLLRIGPGGGGVDRKP